MKEQYIKIKEDYENYLIMFKNGNFYISLNNDAFIMNNIFNYKNFIKRNNYLLFLNRINKINYLLKDNIKNSNMDKVLTKIENILCMINY